ncbi:MAG: PASTA domain-containing protein [Desulfobacteraceae bacterium]|nr:MAG: PASTA domain-containing protein [Desulfobacteraceae bacterium]
MISKIAKISALVLIFIAVFAASTYLSLTLIIKSEDTVVVPELVGKDVIYVLESLTGLGLNTKVRGSEYSSEIPKNHVIRQAPEPGSEVKKGRDIRITISKGATTILMPDLAGLPIQQARIILEENDLCEANVSSVCMNNIERDEIVTHNPPEGKEIERKKCVDLLVSAGVMANKYKMPDLYGLSPGEAILLIEKNRLIQGKIKYFFDAEKPSNIVVSQEPLSGYPVSEKTAVNLVINKEPAEMNRQNIFNLDNSYFFRYRIANGFISRHVRVELYRNGTATDIFDSLIKPSEETTLFIPKDPDNFILIYVDDAIVKPDIIPFKKLFAMERR